MRFEIDTESKTVTLDHSVNLEDFVLQMETMFPHTWKEFTLIPKSFNYKTIFDPVKHDPLFPTFPSMPVMYTADQASTAGGCNTTKVLLKDGKYTDYAGNPLNVTHT